MIPLDAPIAVGAEEAQRQLQTELAKPEYADVQYWWSDLWQRLWDWLNNLPTHSTANPQMLVVVAVVVVAVLAGVVLLAGPLRNDRRVVAAAMFADDAATADQLRDDAARLGQQGQWTQATIQRFRALVRALAQRTVIDESPGMTAHEAVERARDKLPDYAVALGRAADVFDGLAYGHRTGTREHYEQMTALDEDIQRARPVLADGPDGDGPGPDSPPDGTRVSVGEAS